LGRRGEEIAGKYLSRRGYKILERNWRIREGEIDLIAQEKDTLVFIEIKSRISLEYGSGEESVTNLKRLRMIKTAKAYLVYREKENPCRFDVISLTFTLQGKLKHINHIKEAFIV